MVYYLKKIDTEKDVIQQQIHEDYKELKKALLKADDEQLWQFLEVKSILVHNTHLC